MGNTAGVTGSRTYFPSPNLGSSFGLFFLTAHTAGHTGTSPLKQTALGTVCDEHAQLYKPGSVHMAPMGNRERNQSPQNLV